MRGADRGIVLFEVLAAVAILSIAGLSMVALVAQVTDSANLVKERDAEQADESRLLAATTLLNRRDLDLRLGSRAVGPYVVDVTRPEPTLYRIAMRRQQGDVEDLVTVVFRPVPQ